MAENTNSIPESEKLRILDLFLNEPASPFRPEVARNLSRTLKLDLFERLVKTGAIVLEASLSPDARATTPSNNFNTSIDYSALRSVIGDNLNRGTNVYISQQERLQGLYIIGATGTGKSTLLQNLILTDIDQGMGICLIEPHGDLTDAVLAGVPAGRLRDVVLLDMADYEYPFGLNLFECVDPQNVREIAVVSSFISHVFEKVWGAGTDTPRLMQVLRAVTRTFIEIPGTTFAEIPLLFSDDTVRNSLISKLSNTDVVAFWKDFNRKSQRARDEYIESTMNKVRSFLEEPIIRNIVGQTRTTVNFRRIMDEGKILLVKLSPQFKDASLLIGAIVIGKLLMSAYARADVAEPDRRQFNLYCDEFQRFATSDIAEFIAEGSRKFRVPITLAHQTLSQLDGANRSAAAAAANVLAFRVNGEDAATLAKNFDTTPTKEPVGEQPIRAPVSDVIRHLVQRGHNNERVARFGLTHLKNLENFVWDPPHVGYAGPFSNKPSDAIWYGVVVFEGKHIFHEARELLNQSLYQSMVDRSTRFLIPPLALYILSIAQQDGSDSTFMPFINRWEKMFTGFRDDAVVFGDPHFISDEFAPKFIESRGKDVKAAAGAVIRMITELRYTMGVLAQNPVLVDTGQYQPTYQNRTYADMENQIARDLTQLPNFHAKVKLLSGEYLIKTKESASRLGASALDARLRQVQGQMRSETGYCQSYKLIEQKIRERQEKLRTMVSSERPSGDKPANKPAPSKPPPAWC